MEVILLCLHIQNKHWQGSVQYNSCVGVFVFINSPVDHLLFILNLWITRGSPALRHLNNPTPITFRSMYELTWRWRCQCWLSSPTRCRRSLRDRFASASRNFTAISSSWRWATELSGVDSRSVFLSWIHIMPTYRWHSDSAATVSILTIQNRVHGHHSDPFQFGSLQSFVQPFA